MRAVSICSALWPRMRASSSGSMRSAPEGSRLTWTETVISGLVSSAAGAWKMFWAIAASGRQLTGASPVIQPSIHACGEIARSAS